LASEVPLSLIPLVLLACGSDPEPVDCADGFEQRDDGLCYEIVSDDTDPGDTDPPDDEPPTLDDVLAGLPECEGGYDDGRLDLRDGCADGACVGMTYEQFAEALGDAGDCYTYSFEIDGTKYGYYSCSWPNGVSSDWSDDDGDGLPDEGDRAYGVSVGLPFDGGTAEGLSLDTTAACWIAALGEPSRATFTAAEDGDWLLTGLSYPEDGVYVYDSYDKYGDYQPDGWIDNLTLYGSY
jgi:hypothetical protein